MNRGGASRRVAWAALLLFGLAAPMARAQGGLPSAIVESQTALTSAQVTQVRAFVAEQTEDLTSGDPERLSDARKAIVRLLLNQNVSVVFRNALASDLLPTLRRLVATGAPAERINALRIAGELATTSSMQVLTASLDADDAGERFAAVAGMQSCFAAVDRSGAAMGPQTLLGLIDELGSRLGVEQDVAIVDAIIRALEQAGTILNGPVAVRAPAQEAMLRGVGDRLLETIRAGAPLDEAWGRVWMRASIAARNALSAPRVGLRGPARRAAARLAGLQLLWAAAHADGQGRGTVVHGNVTVARGVLGLMTNDLGTLPKLDDDLANGRVGAFRDGVEAIAGQNGLLTRAPFDVPADDLKP